MLSGARLPPPGPSLQGRVGAGPAVDTGPTTAPASPALPRGAGEERGPSDMAEVAPPLCGWWWGERLFLVLFLEELYSSPWGLPGGPVVKNPPSMQETWVLSMGQEDPLEDKMATHSSVFAWRIPWTEEPGGLQSMGSQGIGHD